MPIKAAWYLLIINTLTAAVTVWDKIAAKRHRWRVPESTLMLLAGLGGTAGMLFAMLTARHKIRKKKFAIGVPLMLLAQIALIAFLLKNGLLSV